uniref:Uncharacterized protein n=1 Tax=Octopus bimaculoides TaxID=37653 RepID=A0A0L8GQI6_OCTBM
MERKADRELSVVQPPFAIKSTFLIVLCGGSLPYRCRFSSQLTINEPTSDTTLWTTPVILSSTATPVPLTL